VNIDPGMSQFSINMSGGSGDADLYVRRASQPTTNSYDCRPYLWGNTESCNISNPAAGVWYISVRAYSTYNGVNLNAQWD
jgi:serine protease